MKKNSFLIVAILTVLTSGARAATSQPEAETVVLPTFVVTAPRYQPVERQINASLEEFSRRADQPIAITPELTLRQAPDAWSNPMVSSDRAPDAAHRAKS